MEALLASFLRPSTTGLPAARAAVAGLTDPLDAWRTLANRSLIPPSWVDNPGRRFVQPREPGPWLTVPFAGRTSSATMEETELRLLTDDCIPCAWMEQGEAWVVSFLRCGPTPPTVAACVAMAGDVAGVVRAEALAAQVEERTSAFREETGSQVVWNIAAKPWSISYERRPGRRAAETLRGEAARNTDAEFRARDAAMRVTDQASEEWVGDALGTEDLLINGWVGEMSDHIHAFTWHGNDARRESPHP
ncbi:MAG: hypothetical protein Q8S73_18250 [Deltaproteobacteria bacterium]|nr:hypothetical protein [Deltaproteobacteria bacterium]